jgi:D-alanyl-D-alanine carboxypeptidase
VFDEIERGEARLNTPVVLSDRAVAIGANTMGWPAGTEIELGEAITILTTKSANDIAVAVAESLAGSEATFVTQMNEAAARLGMSDTRFTNPHGLHDPGQYMTARDIAVLSRAMIQRFPRFMPSFAVAEGRVRGEEVRGHNQLLGRFEGADGLKTGYVCAAGWNIAASATRGGRQLVAIVLGGLREGHREEIAGNFLEAGFSGELRGGGLTLGDLARPDITGEPVNMRPYVCEGQTPPARLASFGRSQAPLPRPRPQD